MHPPAGHRVTLHVAPRCCVAYNLRVTRPIDIIEAIVRDDREAVRRLADESPKALRSFVVANAISCDGTHNPAAAEQVTAGGQPIENDTWLALHFAADCGRAEIAAELIDRFGVSVDSRTRYRLPTRARETPLLLASKRGHLDVVDVLLDRGAEVEVRDAASNTPLSRAAAGGHAEIVRRLLDAGANVDAVDGQGRTPLHHAIRASGETTAADTQSNSDAGTDASTDAARSGALAAAIALIDAGADVDFCCPREPDGFTPLHRCFTQGTPDPALLSSLLDRGADPTRPDPRHERTAMDLAAETAREAPPESKALAQDALAQLQRHAKNDR